ncbi:MAG: radical SAM protein [Candidatus Omnitrophica bacterium]|nr:radical SAM protein [Candidatus Omnitrophota bacterium]
MSIADLPISDMQKTYRQFLRYAGCLQGDEAFTGPKRAEIHLTNKCNLDCIACWTFSPLLRGTNQLPQVEIAWNKAERLIRDLAKGGCEEVLFVGGGEPMVHPNIMEALELVKSLGMSAFVTTNMTPVTPKRVQQLVEMGVDRVYVSLWAASPEVYDITHPNVSGEEFRKIDSILREFDRIKSERGKLKPEVIIHNVIFNRNYHEVGAMIDYAIARNVQAVQFTLAYTLPGRTDVLLMGEEQRGEVIRQLDAIPKEIYAKAGIHGAGSFLWEIDIFRSRVAGDRTVEGRYDTPLLDSLPCRIGWFFTVIRANGDVIPCCKGQLKPMGNINNESFQEIWNNSKYNTFRNKGKNLPKSDPYFAEIDCLKMCDNVGQLRTIDHHMTKLRPMETPTEMAMPIIRRLKSG